MHVCPWVCTEVGGQLEGLSGLAAGTYPLSHLTGPCEFLTFKGAFLACTGLGSTELIINKPGKNYVLNEHYLPTNDVSGTTMYLLCASRYR